MDKNKPADGLLEANAQSFWNTITPGDHVVQIYDNEHNFIDLLENFAVSGFNANASVIIIGTVPHLKRIENRLKIRGYDVFALTLSDQYIPIQADEMLEQFMINNWPDENLFRHLINVLMVRAKKYNREVYAFGEMVGLLWSAGHSLATIKLQHLWSRVCKENLFRLYCAYDRSSFMENSENLINNVCEGHTLQIIDYNKVKSIIRYQNLISHSQHR